MCRNDREKYTSKSIPSALRKVKDQDQDYRISTSQSYLAMGLRIIPRKEKAHGVLSKLSPLTYRSCSDTCRSICSCL